MRLAMKHENIIEYVDQRLHEWALWYSKDNSNGLGYPACSLEYRLMTEGIIVKFSGSKNLPVHEKAEEIEALILEMGRQNKNMASALRQQYLTQNKSRERAKEIGVCYAQFRKYVELGQQWLAGRLSGHNAIF